MVRAAADAGNTSAAFAIYECLSNVGLHDFGSGESGALAGKYLKMAADHQESLCTRRTCR